MRRHQQIFIGSPSESRDIADRLARQLVAEGFVPRLWWKEFPAGSYTLDRLRELAWEVDGAVLIATGVDVLKQRDKKSLAPRDNVVLEYGLFVGAVGRERCLLAIDSEAKLPSDCLAITNIHLTDDVDAVAREVADHFLQQFATVNLPTSPTIPTFADPAIVDLSLREEGVPYPREWRQRHLYYGPEGASNWLRLCEQQSYLSQAFHEWERQSLIAFARIASPATYVSLGPGDARADTSAMKMLVANDPTVRYIPVDISEPLLNRAIACMSQIALTPVGVLGDFEEGLAFVHRILRQYAKRPALYALLGGTLGNLDNSEADDFLHQMRSIMASQDRLVLGTSILGKWSKAKDPRCDIKKLDDPFRRFIVHGVGKRLSLSTKECLSKFDKSLRIEVRAHTNEAFEPHRMIEFWWHHGKQQSLCTRICRFALNTLIQELELAGFTVEGEPTIWPATSSPVRFVMMLLKPN